MPLCFCLSNHMPLCFCLSNHMPLCFCLSNHMPLCFCCRAQVHKVASYCHAKLLDLGFNVSALSGLACLPFLVSSLLRSLIPSLHRSFFQICTVPYNKFALFHVPSLLRFLNQVCIVPHYRVCIAPSSNNVPNKVASLSREQGSANWREGRPLLCNAMMCSGCCLVPLSFSPPHQACPVVDPCNLFGMPESLSCGQGLKRKRRHTHIDTHAHTRTHTHTHTQTHTHTHTHTHTLLLIMVMGGNTYSNWTSVCVIGPSVNEQIPFTVCTRKVPSHSFCIADTCSTSPKSLSWAGCRLLNLLLSVSKTSDCTLPY